MGLRRIISLIPSVKRETLKLPQYTKNFGLGIALWRIYDTIWPRTQQYMDAVYSYIQKWCVENLQSVLLQSDAITVTNEQEHYVWTCWWQGEENMPEVVNICISQMRKMLPNSAKLQLITFQNHKQYVDIPEGVIQRYDDGLMSAAAFSDVLRYSLLNRYGGIWIDSTVFLSEKLPEEYFSMPLFTQKDYKNSRSSLEVAGGNWCNFVIGGYARNALFVFMENALFNWWKEKDDVLDYILPDYLIKYAHDNFEDVRALIDQVPINNAGIWNLYNKLNTEYSTQIWEKISRESIFHKLTYKREYQRYTPENKVSIYGYICEKYEAQTKGEAKGNEDSRICSC